MLVLALGMVLHVQYFNCWQNTPYFAYSLGICLHLLNDLLPMEDKQTTVVVMDSRFTSFRASSRAFTDSMSSGLDSHETSHDTRMFSLVN
jgi:hypothetical protein